MLVVTGFPLGPFLDLQHVSFLQLLLNHRKLPSLHQQNVALHSPGMLHGVFRQPSLILFLTT